LASVKGDWFVDLPVVGYKLLAKRISQGIFFYGIIGMLLTLWKRPKHLLLFFFGFANIIFIGFMVGFGAYVKGYIHRFWVDRLYNWPYLFTIILFVLLLLYVLPQVSKRLSHMFRVFGWLTIFGLLAFSQLIWLPIKYFMQPISGMLQGEKVQAEIIAKAYSGGKVLMPEDHPYLTYFLAEDWKIEGKNMVGQMFDPFFYFPDENNLFNNWGDDRKEVLSWLKDENIHLLVLTKNKPSYEGLVQREPELFEVLPVQNSSLRLYRVFPEKINLD
jgi:hypothetical protein